MVLSCGVALCDAWSPPPDAVVRASTKLLAEGAQKPAKIEAVFACKQEGVVDSEETCAAGDPLQLAGLELGL